MIYNEHNPHGSWLAYAKRKSATNKAKSTFMAIVAFAVYAVFVTITETI